MTPTEFLVDHPEFAKVNTARIQRAIDFATVRTDATVFGDFYDEALGYLVAHILATSPTGREAATKADPATTVYLTARRALEDLVGPGQGAPTASDVLAPGPFNPAPGQGWP
jgi:hypothetical protein